MKFIYDCEAPVIGKIPEDEVLGITAIIITCHYRSQEFLRVGYYVNNYYSDPELMENPPQIPNPDLICREILVDEPRVTRFPIKWTDITTTAGTEAEMDEEEPEEKSN